MLARQRLADGTEYVMFGRCHQDDAGGPDSVTPISWLVLEQDPKERRMLLLSRYALDHKPMTRHLRPVFWKHSYLRKWLNHDFAEAAFTPEERNFIITADLENQGNGKDTQDQIFILSKDELYRMLKTPESRICAPSPHVIAEVADAGTYILNGGCCYWLRTPGDYGPESACLITGDGSLDFDFGYDDNYAVRPALWVRLPS
ncbi:DUF6273 domain-containing protein [Succinimonas sp.]|uniref:DUF6273 domain-containing protein n=1 Tax=Succinimonas sp. TaxID=1936151 RepID=UPI0038699D89